jgi:hypothetical protein
MKQMYLNRMAELDAKAPQQDVEIPHFGGHAAITRFKLLDRMKKCGTIR